MAYLQGTSIDRTVYLTLADVPAVGILYTAVTVQVKKQGQNSFTTKVLLGSDWIEFGAGKYGLRFTPNDSDTVGDFTFTLAGAAFDNFLYDEFTIEPAPPNLVPGPAPQQCIVSGTIATQSATPPSREPLKIVAYPAQFPAKYATTMLASDPVWTFADALGNFSLALVRKSVVVIEIKRTGIRAQITVPDSPSANLLDLLPPFTIDYSL